MRVRGTRAVPLLLSMAAVVNSSLLPAQTPPVVAVLPFDDQGSFGQEKEVFQALRLGIPATIAAELSGHSEVRLADPQRVAAALRNQKIGPGSRIDASTAARVGKDAGARYAISGSFADFYGKFRLDVRIVDTESGQIQKVVSNDDPKLQSREDLYRIVQMVGHKVLAHAGGRVAAQPAEREGRVIPTEALTQYSLGLLYESRGERAKAVAHYHQALSRYSDYPEALAGARRVR
jgi:TolB-like protein